MNQIYQLRRLFLGVAAVAIGLTVVLTLGILAVRLADNPGDLYRVAGIVVLAGVVLAILTAAIGSPLPRRIIVELDLTRPLAEESGSSPLDRVRAANRPPTLREVVEGLEKAASDKRVTALVAHVGQAGAGLAQFQELRDAVAAFRRSGSAPVALADGFGEFGPGNSPYYLATAFDEINLQPSGDVGLTGVVAASPFLRGVLDKVGIEPQMDHRHEYKAAMYQFTERKYTRPHKEMMKRIADSTFDQLVAGVAEGRGLTPAAVRELIDRGPLSATEALEADLVDNLAYRDEAMVRIKDANKGAKVLYLQKYAKRAKRASRGRTVALIYGTGAVQAGRAGFSPLTGGQGMGSQSVSAAFRAAVDDKSVKAIVFRVDSPGGSYIGSDTIWRETIKAREAGKPVVVTMGNVAASGGYFVAMAADKIVAHPGTLTGSIGVVAGKQVVAGLQEKIGLSIDEVHNGANAADFMASRKYTRSGWANLQTTLDRIYADFTTKVAESRKLPIEDVQEVAKGRVWTGADAKEIDLIDELGGFPTALRLAKEAAGLDPAAPVKIKTFPKKKTSPLAMLARGGDNSDHEAASAGMGGGLIGTATGAGSLGWIVGLMAAVPGSPGHSMAAALGAELGLFDPGVLSVDPLVIAGARHCMR